MKRLFVLFILVFGFIYLEGQATARTALSRTLGRNVTFVDYTCVAADTVGTEQDTLIFEYAVNKDVPVNVAAYIDVTRTGSTEDYEMRLQGKVFADQSYTSLVDSTAQTADLALYHADVEVDATQAASVTPFYRYFRVLIANDGTCGAADKLTVVSVEFKVWERR